MAPPVPPGSKKLRPDLLNVVLLPEVAALPHYLTDDHKAFWNQLIGDPFRAR
jgi:hypothetical protein